MSADGKPEVALSDQHIHGVGNSSDEDVESPSVMNWTREEEVKAKRKYVRQSTRPPSAGN